MHTHCPKGSTLFVEWEILQSGSNMKSYMYDAPFLGEDGHGVGMVGAVAGILGLKHWSFLNEQAAHSLLSVRQPAANTSSTK